MEGARKIVATCMYFEVVYVVHGEEIRVITVQFRW